MRPASSILPVLLLAIAASPALAIRPARACPLAGKVVNHTANHGQDNRIWSAALHEFRDLYVYLPPGFDPSRPYPLLVWLHGINQDEKAFLQYGLPLFDAAIAAGQLPPLIIAMPDGSLHGNARLFGADPVWLNSRVGRFEDFLMQDVWEFVHAHYPIQPAREAHLLGGFSGGGGAAFRLGMEYRDRVGVVLGIHPPLNLRWVNCRGRYFANFDPDCWGWQTRLRGRQPIARFCGVITIRLRSLVFPLFGRGQPALERIKRENPIEMLDRLDVRPGELAMCVAYGGLDQFNIDAQVESFLYRACERGLTVGVGYEARGRHNQATARRLLPGMIDWLGTVLGTFKAGCPGAGPR
jgi:S-formylglutathione hydrolase FrmB